MEINRQAPFRAGRFTRRALLAGVMGGTLAAVGCGGSRGGNPPSAGSSVTGALATKNAEDHAVRPVYVGYVPYWDQPTGLASVNAHPDVFDQVSLVWYSLDSAGRVVPADDTYAHIDPAAVTALKARRITVVPTVTSLRNGDWKPNLVQSMLDDSAHTSTHVTALRDLAVKNGYDGIDIDYEDLDGTYREAYSGFLKQLSDALHNEGKILTSSVYAKTEEPGPNPHNVAQDYAAIGAACDQVRVMTFDYHYDSSDPGPVAPLDWVESCVTWAATQMPARKVWLGVVLRGYDWGGGGAADGVSYTQATQIAKDNGAQIIHTDPGASPNFTYEKGGAKHEVWFEDSVSSAGKVALVPKLGLGGAIFWSLGGEDPRTWGLDGLKGHRDPVG